MRQAALKKRKSARLVDICLNSNGKVGSNPRSVVSNWHLVADFNSLYFIIAAPDPLTMFGLLKHMQAE
jgi:hypothetical protein